MFRAALTSPARAMMRRRYAPGSRPRTRGTGCGASCGASMPAATSPVRTTRRTISSGGSVKAWWRRKYRTTRTRSCEPPVTCGPLRLGVLSGLGGKGCWTAAAVQRPRSRPRASHRRARRGRRGHCWFVVGSQRPPSRLGVLGGLGGQGFRTAAAVRPAAGRPFTPASHGRRAGRSRPDGCHPSAPAR
jgi:hypothetical protein